jgi:hypothetical protein
MTRIGLLSYWMNGYWSASVVALGGALVLGSWPRIRKHLRLRDAGFMGFGLVILANSRPYEGLVMCVPVAAAMIGWLAGALATGYYYRAVTGSPFRMAYQVNRSTYASAPYFLWQPEPPEPPYRYDTMRSLYRSERTGYEENFTVHGFLTRAGQKAEAWWRLYLGPLLTIPLLVLPCLVLQRKMRLPLAIVLAMIAGFSVQSWFLPHYFSPAFGALYILIVQCLRYLWCARSSGSHFGPALVRAIPVLACAMIVLRLTAVAAGVQIEPAWPRGNLLRAKVEQQLEATPGQHLVIVDYGPHHDPHLEWVYNAARIDAARIVWARDMGSEGNRELLNYFSRRRVWQINPDSFPTRLEPYGDHPSK